MTEEELQLVRRFKSLVEERLHVHEMLVFGSRARGDAELESDLDILVVIDEPETNEAVDFIFGCAFEADIGSNIVITPTIFSRKEWEDGPERSGLLAQAVRREGIPV